MNNTKKKYYRILESIIKKIILIEKKSSNENLKKMVRSAIYNSNLKKNRLLYSENREIKYMMHTSDWISKKLFIDQSFDDRILKKVIKILNIKKNKNILVNIGAHIGSTCIPALKYKYFKSLIAFEPSKKNFNLLAANIFLNDLGNKAKIFNLALSNRRTLLKLKKFQNSGDYRVVEKRNKNVEIIKSDILDNYTKNLNKKNTLIFMDAQGHEPLIFMGSKKTLKKKIPIVFEFAPFLMTGNWQKGFNLIFKNYKYFYDLHKPLIKRRLKKNEIMNLYKKLNTVNKNNYTDILIV